jgi:hypothetical protein
MGIRGNWEKVVLGSGVVAIALVASLWGRGTFVPQAAARPPAPPQHAPSEPPGLEVSSEYTKRVVAYIYDTVPITREELGEYLIARQGVDRLSNLVNLRVIEHVCKQKGIEVTAAEIEADFAETLKGLNVGPKDFENKLLKPHNKTLYEWKEDVIRPRLLLSKLCRDRIHVTEEDLKKAFEAYHGEKIDCRIIMWPKQEKNAVMNRYAKLRDSEEEFDRAARTQASPTLAAAGGQIKPMGRHTTGNEEMEKTAFNLQPGELSRLIETPEGLVVIKCIKRIPPDTSAKLDAEREKLSREVFDKKLQAEIPKYFAQLREQARPNLILKPSIGNAELSSQVQQELQSDPDKQGARTPAPAPHD